MTTEKSVLFLTTNDIKNPIRGCDRRSAQLCSNLPDEWHVDSVSYDKSQTDSSEPATIRPANLTERHRKKSYPRLTAVVPFDLRVFRHIYCTNREYDVIVASAIGSVLYGLIASLLNNATLVVDLHNVDDRLSLEVGDYGRYLFSKVFGRLALCRADVVVLTSEVDRESFGRSIRSKSIVVANGFDSDTFYKTESEPQNRALFFGNMSYEPNREAVEAIADSIAPKLAKSRPEMEIHIAGPSSDSIKDIVGENDNVKVVGLVDEIAPYIRKSRVVIVPLKTGSGTRLKIIESLACGTPVVSTAKGAEGWPDDWETLDIAPIEQFPESIDKFLQNKGFTDEEYREILQYSWTQQANRLVERITEMVNKEQ